MLKQSLGCRLALRSIKQSAQMNLPFARLVFQTAVGGWGVRMMIGWTHLPRNVWRTYICGLWH